MGKPFTFVANVSGASPNATLKYNWTISTGTILEGQGTSSIKVEVSGGMDGNTATVEVEGLDADCPNKASCTTPMIFIRDPRVFDQYGNITLKEEKARLDNLAIQLQNEPHAHGFIIAYGGRISFKGQARERADRAKNYLIGRYNIIEDRIVTIDGGYREDSTVELWITPQVASPPIASPTLRPEDVRIVEKPTRARRRRSP